MKTIYKYPLQATDFQVIRMPTGARILCCRQIQPGHPDVGSLCLWAEVDTVLILGLIMFGAIDARPPVIQQPVNIR